MRLPLATLAASLAVAATALGAAPWGGPSAVTEPNRMATGPLALTSADGTTAVFYRREGGGVPGGVCSFASRAPGAAAFGTPHLLHGGCAGAVTYAKRSVAAMTLTTTRRGNTYSVAFGTTRGSFGRATRIVTGRRVRRAVLAGNGRGALAVAWFEDRGTSNDRVFVRLRPAGGRFGKPLLLAEDRVRSVAAAVGERGDVLVAWDARGRIRTRLRPSARRRFTRAETIRSQDAYSAVLGAAVTANGRAILGWSAQLRSEGGDSGPKLHQVAVRPAGAPRFRPAQLLERDPRGIADLGNLQLVATAAGPPLVAWTGHDGDRAVVRVSEAGADASFQPAATVSQATEDSHLTAAGRGPLGDVTVLWMRDHDTPSAVFAAHRPPGAAAFGPAEVVSTGEDARFGRLAWDSAGRPVAVWEETVGVGDDRVRSVFAADRAG